MNGLDAGAEGEVVRALVFTTVFPGAGHDTHGTFVFERTRHLAEHADVRVVAPLPWPRRRSRQASERGPLPGLRVERPTFYYLPGLLKFLDGFFLFLSSLRCVRRLRRSFDFDLIDAHFAFPDGFAAVLLGRWFRRPVTITLRGTLGPLSDYRLRRWAIRWALRRAARVIAVAEPLAERAAALGVPRERLRVIGNGVDVETFAPRDRRQARRRLGLAPDGKLMVSVGHLCARKGFDRVLRVLPALLDEVPDLTFAIVGGPGAEGNVEGRLRRLAARSGIAGRVVFTGARPPADVALWMSAADLFVLTSDREGCPNVVLEALACGRPVVATRVGSVEQMVPPEAGILLEVGEAEEGEGLRRAILEALARPWDERRIRAHGAARTWSAVAREVLAEWRLAAARPGGRHPTLR